MSQGLRRMLQVNAIELATIDGNRRQSWRELGDRVARFAGALHRSRINAGDRVAVLLLNSDRYIELYLGRRLVRRGDRPDQHALEHHRD